MSSLVLNISPKEMKNHKHEKVFREIFEREYTNLVDIRRHLERADIEHSVEIGETEYGFPLIGFYIEGQVVFSLMVTNNNF